MTTKKTKTKIQAVIKVNTYRIVSDAIERGLALGYQRAFKHTETPDKEAILESQERSVMECLDEYLTFGDDDE